MGPFKSKAKHPGAVLDCPVMWLDPSKLDEDKGNQRFTKLMMENCPFIDDLG
jgi:hypothetical protein